MNNKRVLVVSFFPGNDSPSVVGGFDWIYEDSPAASEWLKGEIDSLASQAGDISFTVVRMMVPVDLDNDEVTNYISRRDEYRELPEQCSDDPG